MRTKALIMGFLATMSSLLNCSAQTEGFRSVDADQFEQVIADTSVVRLDVRTASEYAEGHVADAMLLDVRQDDFEAQAVSKLPKDKTLAIYCRSGNRSKKAAQILVKNGYAVVELNTGYNGWVAAGKAVVK